MESFPTSMPSTEPMPEFASALIEENEQLVSENASLITESSTLQSSMLTKDSEVKELNEKLSKIEGELTHALEMVSQLKEDAYNLARCGNEEANADLQAQIHQKEMENRKLKEKVDEQEKLIANFETEEKELKVELSKWKRPANKVHRENFELKKQIETMVNEGSRLEKSLESDKDTVSKILDTQTKKYAKSRSNKIAAEAKLKELEKQFSELKLSTDKKIVEYEKQVEDLKAKKVSKWQAKVGLVKDFLEEDRRFQFERDLRFVTLCKSLAANFDLQTDDESGYEQGQEVEKNEDTALEETKAPTSENASSAGESNADANIELDVAETLRSSPSESPLPVVVTDEELERADAQQFNVDTGDTEITHDMEQVEMLCHVCGRQFKYKKSLRRHLTFTSCAESLREEDSSANFVLEHEKLPFHTIIVHNNSEQQIQQDTEEPPSPTTFSSGENKSSENEQAEINGEPVVEGAAAPFNLPLELEEEETIFTIGTEDGEIVTLGFPAPAASLQASEPVLSPPPGFTRDDLEKLDSKHVDVDIRSTGYHGVDQVDESQEFRRSESLENPHMYNKCGKQSISVGEIISAVLNQELQVPSSSISAAVDNKSKEHVKQDTSEPPSPANSSSKKKNRSKRQQTDSNHRMDKVRSRAKEGLFYCICGEQFPTDKVLKHHINLPGPINAYFCNICLIMFCDTVTLKEHMTIVHR